jgi:membrane fusion protein (multidrug efflux system)
MPERAWNYGKQSMKPVILIGTLLASALVFAGCSRKTAKTDPGAPEVLVTTVTPRDVPRILERVATLDGFINANINAQVTGYLISRDYKEGNVVKKGDLLFRIDPRPFDAALAQAKATLVKGRCGRETCHRSLQ